MAFYDGDDYDDFGEDLGFGDYEDSFAERYDRANGAPFGTFDLNGDGDLDFVEKDIKFDHYQSMWDEEDGKLAGSNDYFLDEFIDDDIDDENLNHDQSFENIFIDRSPLEEVSFRDNLLGNDIKEDNDISSIEDKALKNAQLDAARDRYDSYDFESAEEMRVRELEEKRARDQKRYEDGFVEGTNSKAFNYFCGLDEIKKGTREDFEAAIKHLTFAKGYYPDIPEKIQYCQEKINGMEYDKAKELMEKKEYKKAMKIFQPLEEYEDARDNYEKCKKEHEKNLIVAGAIALAFLVVVIIL